MVPKRPPPRRPAEKTVGGVGGVAGPWAPEPYAEGTSAVTHGPSEAVHAPKASMVSPPKPSAVVVVAAPPAATVAATVAAAETTAVTAAMTAAVTTAPKVPAPKVPAPTEVPTAVTVTHTFTLYLANGIAG